MDGAPREALAAAKALRHELHRVPARFFERVRRLQARIDVPVHGPLRDEVGDHRTPADARLVLGHKMVVRDDVGDKMRCITEYEGAVLIAARCSRDAAQGGPAVRAQEGRRAEKKPAADRLPRKRYRSAEASRASTVFAIPSSVTPSRVSAGR